MSKRVGKENPTKSKSESASPQRTSEKTFASDKKPSKIFANSETYFLALTIALVIVALCTTIFLASVQPKESASVEESKCTDVCRLQLVETIPENVTFPTGSPVHTDTYASWLMLLENSIHNIDIGSFYWTMRQEDVVKDPSAWKGEDIFKRLLDMGKDKLRVRIVQNENRDPKSMQDTEILVNEGAADVRTLDFARLQGSGIIHTKMWLTDSSNFYVGSANMDWRALTQVKELGIMVSDCSCMGNDLQKVFDVYWMLGAKDAVIPSKWPDELSTKINMENPMLLEASGLNETMYISVAPPSFLPEGRTSDLSAVLNIIDNAKEFINIALMDYFPITLFSKENKYWPLIDDRLRAAAFERGVQVKLMPSWWNNSRPELKDYLRSLQAIDPAVSGSVEVKLFEVPIVTPEQGNIPYARVNHNKYMVTETTALISTSNWSGDYFINTAGVSIVVSQKEGSVSTDSSVHVQLKAVFDRDWYSPYAKSINDAGSSS